MNITYADWATGACVLVHVISVPETSNTRPAEISIGVRLDLAEITVVVETTLAVAGVTSDLDTSNTTHKSDFEGRPSALYARIEKPTLHAAINECDVLKAAFEFKIFTLVDEDRKAFERSLSGA